MSNILDIINVRLNQTDNRVRALDETVTAERDARVDALGAHERAIRTLQAVVGDMRDELLLRRQLHDEQTARIDALIGQLTQLGVSPNV